MRGYFAFGETFCAPSGIQNHFRFLFKAPGLLNEKDLADAIEFELQQVLYPDALTILCAEDELEAAERALRTVTVLQQARKRASSKTAMLLGGFDKSGDVKKVQALDNPVSSRVELRLQHGADICQALANGRRSAAFEQQ